MDQIAVTLSNEYQLIADLYVPRIAWFPKYPQNLRVSLGFVTVDEHIKVKGAEDTWAISGVVGFKMEAVDMLGQAVLGCCRGH